MTGVLSSAAGRAVAGLGMHLSQDQVQRGSSPGTLGVVLRALSYPHVSRPPHSGTVKGRGFMSLQVLGLRDIADVKCDANDEAAPGGECKPLEAPCLFNVVTDPCERRNLASR